MKRPEINSANQSFERTGIYRFVASLFLQTRFKSVSFDDKRAAFNTKRISLSFKYSQIQSIHLQGKLFKKVTIKAGLQRLTFRGLSKKDSKILLSMFETASNKAWFRTFQPMVNDVEQIDGWIQNFWERKYW